MHALPLFNPLIQLIPFALSLLGPVQYFLHFNPELPFDSLNYVFLPPVHLLPILIEPLKHLVPLPLKHPLLLPQLLQLVLHSRQLP